MSHFNQKCDISEALKPLEQAILRIINGSLFQTPIYYTQLSGQLLPNVLVLAKSSIYFELDIDT